MKRRQFIGAGLTVAAGWPCRGFAAVAPAARDLPAKSLDGDELILRGKDVEDFAAGLRGELMLADHAGYEARRRLWNASFDRKPALIACCSGAADVRRAVQFAGEHRLLTAVRAGGHSFSGKSTCEGGLVIDLQSMRGVRVESSTRRAHLESGSLLGELDHETAPFALATTAGTVSHTGAAGLTLGGGFGRLGRRFGLACDNVAAFDVVTADGRFVRASESENPDLHWGLRGGGGNFGVVTRFEYVLHPMDPVILGGNVFWPIDQARDVMRMYRDVAPTAPDHLTLECGLLWLPDGPTIYIEVCWSGDHADGESWLRSLRAFGKPAMDGITRMPYVKLQSSLDEFFPPGAHCYAKNGFLTALDEDGIDRMVGEFRRAPGLFALFLMPAGGQYSRVAVDASAFPHRNAQYWLGMVARWQDAAASDGKIAAMRSAWDVIEPVTAGFYTNLADQDTTLTRYRENYGVNLERLVALKAKYDPTNLFRLNANVPPKI